MTEADYRPERAVELRGLIGRVPDPVADRGLLAMLARPMTLDALWLAEVLVADEKSSGRVLRELLPGLGLVEAPGFTDRLGVKAANGLIGADVRTVKALAGMAPASILALPLIGPKTATEILAVAIGEWASSYLAEDAGRPADAPKSRVADVPVAGLAGAFAEIEELTGFKVFLRRQINSNASQTELAAEGGVSAQRVYQLERKVEAALSKSMRDEKWPVGRAVKALKAHLGPVARRADLEKALREIEPSGEKLGEVGGPCPKLLFWLAGYRIDDQWAYDVEIAAISDAVLAVLTGSGVSDLGAASRYLGRLGVREELRLPWIVSRPGYQVVDGSLVRTAGERRGGYGTSPGRRPM